MKATTATTTEPRCYLRVDGQGWAQEHYETASCDAAKRTRYLRSLGYKARSSALGMQVTKVGLIRMTLVDIRYDRLTGEPPPWPTHYQVAYGDF